MKKFLLLIAIALSLLAVPACGASNQLDSKELHNIENNADGEIDSNTDKTLE